MKKGLLFSALLASLLLVGCASEDKPSNGGNNSENTEETIKAGVVETVGEAKLVASYDFSSVSVATFDDGPYFCGKGETVDIKDQFTNSVTNSKINIASVMTLEKGPMKGILDQGPKCGGIKLNKAGSGFKVTLATDSTVDYVEVTLAPWKSDEGYTVGLNDLEAVVEASAESSTIIFASENMSSFELKSVDGRPTITSIKLYNK